MHIYISNFLIFSNGFPSEMLNLMSQLSHQAGRKGACLSVALPQIPTLSSSPELFFVSLRATLAGERGPWRYFFPPSRLRKFKTVS